MKNCCIILGILAIVWHQGCQPTTPKQEDERIDEADVVMVTDTGEIYIKLYDETPIHKENFLKLCREGFYDGIAFHRIIQDFMVQIGDPRTKEGADRQSREDDAGYTLPAEISEKLLHTKGKLAAARYPDEMNPAWESSSSQFYIVTGKWAKPEDLDNAEMAMNYAREMRLRRMYNALKDSGSYTSSFNNYLSEQGFKEIYYTEEQRAIYDQMQGFPSLDFQYTIFGEVVGGMDVVNRIERLPTAGEIPTVVVRIEEMKVIDP
ncbi:MAG: peptidylprolyl isomerase [Bacteroidota bacterium]